jgi:hypothetical protein
MTVILKVPLSPWLWVKSCYLLCDRYLVDVFNMAMSNTMVYKGVEIKYRGLF